MPFFDAPYLEFTDAVGLCRLTAFVPRLTGFTPDVDPKGPRHAALGDGTSYQFLFRTDYPAKFTLPNVPAWQLPELLRLKAWLISGGVVTLYTADLASRIYSVKLREGTTPEIRFTPDDMEYAIDLEVVNAAATPLPVVALYEGAGLLMTPDTDYLALGGIFSRSQTARYLAGPTPLLAEEAGGVLRRRHYVGSRRTYLMGPADKNYCQQSEDLSLWTPSAGTGSATGGQGDPKGGATAYLLNDTDVAAAKFWESPDFAPYLGAHTTRGFSWYVKAGTSSIPDVEIIDVTAGNVVRARFLHTITAGVPVVTQTAGTGAVVAVVPSSTVPGYYRVLVYVSGLTVANVHRLRAYPASAVTAAATGTTVFWGFHAHELAVPASEYIPNLAAAGYIAVSGDALSLLWTPAPGAVSWYIRYVEIGGQFLGPVQLLSHIVARLGVSNAARLTIITTSSGLQRFDHESGGSIVGSSLPLAAVYGDVVELLGVLYQDGSTQLLRSINGGAVVAGTRTGPLALAQAWSNQLIALGSSATAYAHDRFAVFPGVYTLDECRALARVG